MKTKYHEMRTMPYFLSIFHPLTCEATIRKITVEKRLNVEYTRPEKGGKIVLEKCDSHRRFQT